MKLTKNLHTTYYKKIFAFFIINQSILLALSFVSKVFNERFDKSRLDSYKNNTLTHLCCWDAMHFMNIVKKGYFYEHCMAFLPLHMGIIKNISEIFSFTYKNIQFDNTFLITVILNNIYFVISAMLMYRVVFKLTSNHIYAYKCSKYFMINIPSIVYSSMYTESLFTMIFLMEFLQTEGHSTILNGINGLVRSNSVVCALVKFSQDKSNAFLRLFKLGVMLSLFGLFQCFCLLLYCKNNCRFSIIIPYNFIQKNYWNQGILKFLCTQQIPNILIGLPFVIMFGAVLIQTKAKNTYLFNILLIKYLLLVFTMHWNMGSRFLSFHPYFYMWLVDKNNKNLTHFVLVLRTLYIILYSAYYPPA